MCILNPFYKVVFPYIILTISAIRHGSAILNLQTWFLSIIMSCFIVLIYCTYGFHILILLFVCTIQNGHYKQQMAKDIGLKCIYFEDCYSRKAVTVNEVFTSECDDYCGLIVSWYYSFKLLFEKMTMSWRRSWNNLWRGIRGIWRMWVAHTKTFFQCNEFHKTI